MYNYKDYLKYSKKIYDVYMSMSVLNWDMETHMPKNGNKFRAQQLSTLAKIAYDLGTRISKSQLRSIHPCFYFIDLGMLGMPNTRRFSSKKS